MLSAIVYNSTTGSCKKYAEILSARLHIPCHPLNQSYVRSDGKVLYVSWVMAGKVVGYARAAKKLNIAAVAAVGMAPVNEKSAAAGRKANGIPDSIAYFPLQGGFNINKLPGPMKLIMQWKVKDIAKRLQAKGSLNAQEQATYKMATTGVGGPASWDVSEILTWCKEA